jgi:hypothetical protein
VIVQDKSRADANARSVFDHARPILIRRSRIVANSALASGLVCGMAARTPCISQHAAVEAATFQELARWIATHHVGPIPALAAGESMDCVMEDPFSKMQDP